MAVFSIGLDLGQKRDYSALVVAERVQFMTTPGHSAEQSFGGADPDAEVV